METRGELARVPVNSSIYSNMRFNSIEEDQEE
jgi:hypothetical protein